MPFPFTNNSMPCLPAGQAGLSVVPKADKPLGRDCGPLCLRMIAKHYGKTYSLQNLRDKSYITREGVSMLGISDAAEAISFRSMGVRITFEQLLLNGSLLLVGIKSIINFTFKN